tara:strand:+ start:153 stop:293 length:141 start_codon:yes stop_codon:yes gene_type:complete
MCDAWLRAAWWLHHSGVATLLRDDLGEQGTWQNDALMLLTTRLARE